MQAKTVRLPVMMEPEMIEKIDDWSFKNRIRTKAGAVRALITRGLAAEKLNEKEKADATA